MIYGVDLDPIAAGLAQLAVQLHTSEPGQPVVDMRRNLIQGNSLTGLATVQDLLNARHPETAWVRDELLQAGRAAAAAALYPSEQAEAVLSAIDFRAITRVFDEAAARLGGEAGGIHFPVRFPQVFRSRGSTCCSATRPGETSRPDPSGGWSAVFSTICKASGISSPTIACSPSGMRRCGAALTAGWGW